MHLKMAHKYQPKDADVLKQLGDVYMKLAERSSATGEAFRYTHEAKISYLQAVSLNPLEVEIAFGMAEAEATLEKLHTYLHPGDKNIPYDARPYFEKTLQFRPYGIFYHYAFSQYLYEHGELNSCYQ